MGSGWCFDCWNLANLIRWRPKTDRDMRMFEKEAAHLEDKPRLTNTQKTLLTCLRKTPRVKRVGFCPRHYMYQLEAFLEDKGMMEDFLREIM